MEDEQQKSEGESNQSTEPLQPEQQAEQNASSKDQISSFTVSDFDLTLTKTHTFAENNIGKEVNVPSETVAFEDGDLGLNKLFGDEDYESEWLVKGSRDARENLKEGAKEIIGNDLASFSIATHHNNPDYIAGYMQTALGGSKITKVEGPMPAPPEGHPDLAIQQYHVEGSNDPLTISYINATGNEFNAARQKAEGKNVQIEHLKQQRNNPNEEIQFYDDDPNNIRQAKNKPGLVSETHQVDGNSETLKVTEVTKLSHAKKKPSPPDPEPPTIEKEEVLPQHPEEQPKEENEKSSTTPPHKEKKQEGAQTSQQQSSYESYKKFKGTKSLEPQNTYEAFQALGLPLNASFSDVKKTYRTLSRQYHPDKNPDDDSGVEYFKAVSGAYTMLGNGNEKEYEAAQRSAQNEQQQYKTPGSQSFNRSSSPPQGGEYTSSQSQRGYRNYTQPSFNEQSNASSDTYRAPKQSNAGSDTYRAPKQGKTHPSSSYNAGGKTNYTDFNAATPQMAEKQSNASSDTYRAPKQRKTHSSSSYNVGGKTNYTDLNAATPQMAEKKTSSTSTTKTPAPEKPATDNAKQSALTKKSNKSIFTFLADFLLGGLAKMLKNLFTGSASSKAASSPERGEAALQVEKSPAEIDKHLFNKDFMGKESTSTTQKDPNFTSRYDAENSHELALATQYKESHQLPDAPTPKAEIKEDNEQKSINLGQ